MNADQQRTMSPEIDSLLDAEAAAWNNLIRRFETYTMFEPRRGGGAIAWRDLYRAFEDYKAARGPIELS
jgi:hypothetical protein